MSKLLQILLPQEKKFFPLFEKASGNLYEAACLLHKTVKEDDAEKREKMILEIENLEHVGDNITHEIYNELKMTFITPFDREDIHELASALDDVVDYINGSAKRILLYKVDKMYNSFIKLAELIENSAFELNNAIFELRNLKNINKLKEACIRVNSNENLADEIFENAIANLFHEEQNAIEIIKIKDVLTLLETATDGCEGVANVIESITVKNS